MIEAREFIHAVGQQGFSLWCGVPCSYLTPFINGVLSEPGLAYIASANEGDAVATAAGSALGGRPAIAMMQNSGLGNAVSPLTSLTHVFRLPLLLIVTWRGDPDHPDEPQHSQMGPITPGLLELMAIPWAWFPQQPEQIAPVLQQATEYMQREQRPFALLMRKGSVRPHPLSAAPQVRPAAGRPRPLSAVQSPQQPLASRQQALARIVANTPPERCVVLTTTGFTGRELYGQADRDNQLYMVGSMGCAPAFGLGLALALQAHADSGTTDSEPPIQVVVIDGDGAALMRMGNFATLGSYGPDNLTHILLDNGVYDSTGAQATVSASVDFAAIAHACGYGDARCSDSLSVLDQLFDAIAAGEKACTVADHGPRFVQLNISPGTTGELPRPALTPEQVKQRLMAHLAVSPFAAAAIKTGTKTGSSS